MVASSAFAAVLLTDIVSSTQLRIRLGASFTRLLREHDELVTRVLDGHGALTREDTGDGFLATFDSTTAALQAACALQWAVVERNAVVAPDQRFQIRVVLAAGELYGRPDKRSGLALVDVARLENATEADEVRCTDVFRLLASEQSPGLFSGAEDVAFQGLDDPRRVWQVDWRAAPPFPGELPLPAPLAGPPDELFVGRERSWPSWSGSGARWRTAATGWCWCGAGPAWASRRWPGASPATSTPSAAGCSMAVASRSRGRRSSPSPRPWRPSWPRRGSSRQLLGRFPERLARLLPDRQRDDDAPAAGDQEADRFELFEAIADWLALISAREPVLLVVDDLNWADRATLDLLRHVVRAGHLGSVCILATYRTVEEDQSPAFRLEPAGAAAPRPRARGAHPGRVERRPGPPGAGPPARGSLRSGPRRRGRLRPGPAGLHRGQPALRGRHPRRAQRRGPGRPARRLAASGRAGRPRRAVRRAGAVPGPLRPPRPARPTAPRRRLPHGPDLRGGRRRPGGRMHAGGGVRRRGRAGRGPASCGPGRAR